MHACILDMILRYMALHLQRFVPSEFGTDHTKLKQSTVGVEKIFDDKMEVRKAIDKAGIPYTYICANCYAAYFLGNLCEPYRVTPSRDTVSLLGDGSVKGIYASNS